MALENKFGPEKIQEIFGYISTNFLDVIGFMCPVGFSTSFVIFKRIFAAENEFDQAGDESWLEVEVVDPLFDMMGIEVFIYFQLKQNWISHYINTGCLSTSCYTRRVFHLYG